jgi:hypothetical protein
MYPSILPTTVGSMKGLILENEKVRVVLIPEFGARILSLTYKPTEWEFAWHDPRVPMGKPTREVEFENVSGFFDCVPTCEPCTFKGRKLPPAGEVAFEPWRVVKKEKRRGSIAVTMQRQCDVYPLMVRKSVTISRNEPVVKLDYKLTNLSEEVLEYHYSGHNTLRIEPTYRIVLPSEVTEVKRGMAVTDRLGNLGDEIPWPMTADKSGKALDLSMVGQPCDGTGENLYTPKLKEAWCAAFNESRREAIGFSFQAEVLPYILVWINYGGWRDYYHMPLEPTTGRPDNLEVAVNEWKNYAALQPRSEVSWTEKIFVNHDVKHIERISSENGIIQ